MYNYDEQIERLTKNPEDIYKEWMHAKGLFKYLEDGSTTQATGCITMIKGDSTGLTSIKNGKVLKELVEEIQNDDRLPKASFEIKIEHLPVFKYYQEKYDNI